MQELLLVNPKSRKRRASTKKRRKNPSAAQLANRRRFAAAAKARSKSARAANPSKRRRVSVKRRKARRSNPAQVTIMAKRRTRRSNPSVRRARRSSRRSNPSGISFKAAFSRPMSILKPALLGAAGAAAVNTVLARLPLPPALMTGRARYLTQAAAAIGLAMVAGKLGVRGTTAADMARGSLTVTAYDLLRDVAAQAGFQLNGMGYYLPGLGVQAVPNAGSNAAPLMNGMGKYMTGPGSPQAMNGLRGGSRVMSFNR